MDFYIYVDYSSYNVYIKKYPHTRVGWVGGWLYLYIVKCETLELVTQYRTMDGKTNEPTTRFQLRTSECEIFMLFHLHIRREVFL